MYLAQFVRFQEALFRATMRVGRKQNSQVLMANAWHHRSDSFSSVIALIGIFGSRFSKLRLLDPLAGMAVAGMVGWMGLRIGVEAMLQLTDTSDLSIVDAVHGAAANVDGVLGVDQRTWAPRATVRWKSPRAMLHVLLIPCVTAQVRQRSMGGQSMVDLAIQVDPIQSASAAHKIAEEVRALHVYPCIHAKIVRPWSRKSGIYQAIRPVRKHALAQPCLS
eukprot:scaffold132760_cov31-Tisochrysis_lutea.AAC.3